MHLKKEVREEELFVNEEEEDDDEVLTVSELPLLVEQRVGGVEFLGLPCLSSGGKSNLTSDDMADIQRQGIAVDAGNNPAPKNNPDEVPQLEEGCSWRPEGII